MALNVSETNINRKYRKYTDSTKRSYRNSNKASSSSILVVVFLILISIGGFYFLTKKNSDNEDQQEVLSETEESSETEVLGDSDQDTGDVEVEITEKKEDEEAEGETSGKGFSLDEQSIGGEKVKDVSITDLANESFEGFFRVIFTLDSSDIPYSTATLIPESNLEKTKMCI